VLHGDPAAIIADEAKRYRNTLVILGHEPTEASSE
jgi:hypothetical protein